MNILQRHINLPMLGLAVLGFVASSFGWAQVTGAISGHVEDASGAAVGGVNVTITSQETGAARTVTTGADGNYNASALPVGPQEIRAAKTGFKTEIRSGVRLVVGQDAVVNLKLEVGELNQQVTVTAEAPLVNTTTSSVSGLVGEREVKELPLNGRSFDNLVALNPGAISYALKSANTSTSNGNTFVVAGRRPSDYILLMNGVEYTGSSQLAVTPGGVSGELLGIDAVREFNVLSDTYSAEYGKRAGAQVTVVTQSGSNHVHGSVFEFLRNSALDSRSFLDKGNVPPFRRNQFGGALGGPIKKDKLFLFGNYEGFRQSLAVSSVSIVPDAAARTGVLPGSPATVTGLVPAMLNYMSFWPVANGQNLGSGVALSFNNPKQSIHENFGTTRADYILRGADTLSAAYTIDDGNSIIPQVDPLFGSALALRGQVASLQETHIFSPRLLNSATFGYSRAAYNLEATVFTTLDPSLDFVSGQGPGGIVIGGGTTTTGGSTVITSAGPNNAAGAWNRRNLFTYSDNVQWTHGIHQLTFGGWLQRMRDNEDSASRQLGAATFTSLTTFLQGTASNFQVIPSANELGWRTWFGAWFVEDNIRLRPNLTLRVGLRDEFNNGYNEVSGRAANYITDGNGVLLTTPRVADSIYTQNNATHLFGPRIGLAWDPFGNGKTAIRAGYGIYYSQIDALAFLLNSLPPWNGSATYTGALSSFLPITAGQQPPAGTTFAPQGVQPDAKTPTVQQWNLTIERQLMSNMALRVAYVGSFGYHGLLNVDPNSIPAQVCSNSAGCASGGVCTATTCGTATASVPMGAVYIPGGAKRPNQNLSGGFFWYTEGNTSYNGLQTDVTRRMTNGLQIRANFTWSKSLDMNSGPTGAQAQNQAQMILNRNNVRQDWGPSALNASRQASISGSYVLPFGRGKRFFGSASGVADKLASGWQINGIATLLSGFPFTPQLGANYSGDGDTRNPDRPSLNPAFSGPVVLGNPGQWFNPAAFVRPTPGTYGNLGRSVYVGPGLADADVSVTKMTAVRESVSLQFRAEFFNLLNRSNFGTPNATVFSGTSVSPSAGLITTQATFPRQIQFGLKLVF